MARVKDDPGQRRRRLLLPARLTGGGGVAFTLKLALSLDGRVATSRGESQWITSEASRRLGHRLRATHDAILVGAGTVRADDPRLDTRLARGSSPRPVILDGALGLFVDERPWRFVRPGALVVHGTSVSAVRRRRAEALGVTLVEAPLVSGRVDVSKLPERLAMLGVRSVLVEGGGAVTGSFVLAGLWHRLHCFVAPLFLGEGRAAVSGLDVPALSDAPRGEVLHREGVRGGQGDTWMVLTPSRRRAR